MISYDQLWNTMKRKGISQYRLIHDFGVSAGQISRLRANQNVSTHTLNFLCQILQCELSDVAMFIEDTPQEDE